MTNLQIGIIGPEEKNITELDKKELLPIAEEIGGRIAKNKAVLITGGCTGVVESACKGAVQNGGITVGTPGRERKKSVPNVTVEICTPIEIGDYIFAGILSCDVIIVLPGDAGTIAELAIAYRNKIPLIFLQGYEENMLEKLFKNFKGDYPYYITKNPEEAVDTAVKIGKENLGETKR